MGGGGVREIGRRWEGELCTSWEGVGVAEANGRDVAERKGGKAKGRGK